MLKLIPNYALALPEEDDEDDEFPWTAAEAIAALGFDPDTEEAQ